jgi:hypothetical protein
LKKVFKIGFMREKIRLVIQALQEILAELDGIEPQLPPSAVELLESGICLNCKKKIDGDSRATRGVHRTCFQRIWREIDKGRLTETDAIIQGILAPKAIAGRRRITNDGLSAVLESRSIVENVEDATIEKYAKGKKPKQK